MLFRSRQYISPVAALVLLVSTTSAIAQPVPPGRLTGTVGDQEVDLALNCSSWDAEDQRVSTMDDGPYDGLDSNGDGTGFSFSHFAPVAEVNPFMGTSAEIMLSGEMIQIGPAFRAEDDATWAVDENGAIFEGASGAANDLPVSLRLDCAPRSAEEQGYIGRVTGVVDGREIILPLSCETWEDEQATQEQTPPDADVSVELFVMRQNGQGTVTVETPDNSYQMVAMGDRFEITEDTVGFANTYNRDGTTYDVSLTFDCSNREVLETMLEIGELSPPMTVSSGAEFTVSLSDVVAGQGDMIVITDENPGWLATAMRSGDTVTLTAPRAAGSYRVEYLKAPELEASAEMELLVE